MLAQTACDFSTGIHGWRGSDAAPFCEMRGDSPVGAPQQWDISVVLSTYNRADILPDALTALLCQNGDVRFEVIVVDNRSTDHTARVVADLARTPLAAGRLRYTFEPRQGLSYGRNTGIALARGAVIAFTDDDVRVAPDWAQRLKEVFDARPDVDYLGGRVLPRWSVPPPSWLTTAHWSPLALQDYGDHALISSRHRAICLVGANLAFRRTVFERVGLFTPELGRIKDGIGSTEDHDLQLRVWRAGMQGLYHPAIVAVSDIAPDRMVKSYHRRWHRGHGRHCAMMRLRELVPADLGPMSEPEDIITLFGSPGFVYADLARTAFLWIEAIWRRKDPFFYANQFRHRWSYIRMRYTITSGRRSPAAELACFARAYLRKRRSRSAAAAYMR
jgi:glycosyltransferase involved in cell wall biosynthesis